MKTVYICNMDAKTSSLRLRQLIEIRKALDNVKESMEKLYEINEYIKKEHKVREYWSIYSIPKKSGGHREIFVPDDSLKMIYKHIYKYFILIDEIGADLLKDNDYLLFMYLTKKYYNGINNTVYSLNWNDVKRHFEDNKYAHGFTKGKSIVTHAKQHCDSKYFLKMDIEKAYPSIKGNSIYSMVYLQFLKGILLEHLLDSMVNDLQSNSYFICTDCCPDLRNIKMWSVNLTKSVTPLGFLATGVSLSPWLLNRYLQHFDIKVGAYCKNMNYIYSRYADDICISSNTPIRGKTIGFIRNLLSVYRMKPNEKKTVRQTYKQKNVITGIVITYDKTTKKGHLGIGHKVIDDLKKQLYKFESLDIERQYHVIGLMSYLKSVDYQKYIYLSNKYKKQYLINF